MLKYQDVRLNRENKTFIYTHTLTIIKYSDQKKKIADVLKNHIFMKKNKPNC